MSEYKRERNSFYHAILLRRFQIVYKACFGVNKERTKTDLEILKEFFLDSPQKSATFVSDLPVGLRDQTLS